jgi:hypothetical protein
MQSADSGRDSRSVRRHRIQPIRMWLLRLPSGQSLGPDSAPPSARPPATPPSARRSGLEAAPSAGPSWESTAAMRPAMRYSAATISRISNACTRRGTRSLGSCGRRGARTGRHRHRLRRRAWPRSHPHPSRHLVPALRHLHRRNSQAGEEPLLSRGKARTGSTGRARGSEDWILGTRNGLCAGRGRSQPRSHHLFQIDLPATCPARVTLAE